MSDPIRISDLPQVSALGGDEIVPLVQGGVTRVANIFQMAFAAVSTEEITLNTINVSSIADIDILNTRLLNVSASATFTLFSALNSSVDTLVVATSATIPTLGVTTFSALTASAAIADFQTLTATTTATFAAATVSSNFSALNSSISFCRVSSLASIDHLAVSSESSFSGLISVAGAVTASSNVTLGSSTSTLILNPISITRPNAPAFLAQSTGTQTNVTGNSTAATVSFGESIYDRAGSYSTGTNAFTANITGLYSFCGAVGLTGFTSNHSDATVSVVINSSRSFRPQSWSFSTASIPSSLGLGWALQTNVTSGHTVQVQTTVTGASSGVDVVVGATGAAQTWFSGYLIG